MTDESALKMKKLKVVVRDHRKEISEDMKREYQRNFWMKDVKQEEEEEEVKEDPEQDFLFAYQKKPKMPKKEVIRMNVGGKVSTTFSDHQCDICKRYLTSSQSLKSHRKLHFQSADFECEKCKKVLHKARFRTHNCNFTCQICNAKSQNLNKLKRHMKFVHKIETIKNGFTCDLCGDSFKNKMGLKLHLNAQSCGGRRKFFCDHCEMSFVMKNKIRRHVLRHTTHKIECKICKLKIRSSSLENHMKRSHPAKKENLKCETCSKVFIGYYLLQMHSLTHRKKIQCTQCHLKFGSIGGLNSHMKFHLNPEQFRCKICQYQAQSKAYLNVHLKTHDKNRAKTFKCNRCDFKGYNKSSLKFHIKYHARLDEKLKKYQSAVKCDKCPSVLKNKSLFLHHLRTKHGNRKKFQCDLCEVTTKNKGNLKQHLFRKHFPNL